MTPNIVLRPGAITPSELSAVLGTEVLLNHGKVGDKDVPKAPGMKYRHYAPKAQVLIVDQISDFNRINLSQKSVAVVALTDVLAELLKNYPNANHFSLGQNIADAGHFLFEALRYFDDLPEIKTIYVQGFGDAENAEAYMNRLNKAAAGKHFQ